MKESKNQSKITAKNTSAEVLNKESISQVTSGTAQSDSGTKNSVREKIAPVYVYSFLGIIGGVLLISFHKGYTINDIKDLLLAISGIMSGPLGFIIGFYFKEEIMGNK